MAKCPNIHFCKFLKKYPNEIEKWSHICNDDFMAEECYRFQWCKCDGVLSEDINPKGEKVEENHE